MKKLISQGYSNVSFQEALRSAEVLVSLALGQDTAYTVVESSVLEDDGHYWYELEIAYK